MNETTEHNEPTAEAGRVDPVVMPKIGAFWYCNDCGTYGRYEKNKICSCGSDGSDSWTHSRFRRGDVVKTEFGNGVVVGIDLPRSDRAWRWMVLINIPGDKHHSFIAQQKPMAFFDHEVFEA